MEARVISHRLLICHGLSCRRRTAPGLDSSGRAAAHSYRQCTIRVGPGPGVLGAHVAGRIGPRPGKCDRTGARMIII